MEQNIQFHIEDFEGPLDLLLALVQKNKMSIYEIEIMTLIDQYMDIVGKMSPEAMESASEFITMASRFVQMKSALLLPRSEEGERIREELTGLLVEYSACKAVAAKLKEMAADVYIVARKPMEQPEDKSYKGVHSVKELSAAFSGIAGRAMAKRAPEKERFDEIVTRPFVSVTGRVIHVLRGMKTGSFSHLAQLFAHCDGRSETVATFLAVLELIRGSRITIDEQERLSLVERYARAQRSAKETGSVPAS